MLTRSLIRHNALDTRVENEALINTPPSCAMLTFYYLTEVGRNKSSARPLALPVSIPSLFLTLEDYSTTSYTSCCHAVRTGLLINCIVSYCTLRKKAALASVHPCTSVHRSTPLSHHSTSTRAECRRLAHLDTSLETHTIIPNTTI